MNGVYRGFMAGVALVFIILGLLMLPELPREESVLVCEADACHWETVHHGNPFVGALGVMFTGMGFGLILVIFKAYIERSFKKLKRLFSKA